MVFRVVEATEKLFFFFPLKFINQVIPVICHDMFSVFTEATAEKTLLTENYDDDDEVFIVCYYIVCYYIEGYLCNDWRCLL